MDLVLQIQQNKYPFGKCGLKVEEIQVYPTIQELREKQRLMIKRDQMLSGPYVVRLLSTKQEGLILKYYYEYVPHSLQSYLMAKRKMNSSEWQLKKTQIIKKLVYEITMIVGFLARNRVQTDLTYESLGVTQAQKVKIHIGTKARMGIRSQLFLIAHYTKIKEDIIKYLNAMAEAASHQIPESEGSIKVQQSCGNRVRRWGDSSQEINAMNWQNDVFKPIQQQKQSPNVTFGLRSTQLRPSKQKQIQTKIKSKNRKMSANDFDIQGMNFSHVQHTQDTSLRKSIPKFMKRKMSANDFDVSGINYPPSQPSQHQPSVRSSRAHKHSFNVHNLSYMQQEFAPEEDYSPTAKTIKIEMQQQKANGKQRKDSYKVKITTYRQYQINDPQQLFEGQQGLADYFAKSNKNNAQQQESNISMSQSEFKQGLNQSIIHKSPTSPSTPLLKMKKTISTEQIAQQVRLARQRSNQMMQKIKQWRK